MKRTREARGFYKDGWHDGHNYFTLAHHEHNFSGIFIQGFNLLWV